MDDTDAVTAYIEAISPENRPLFDRLHRLITTNYPDVTLTLSYQMPMYRVGDRRLFVGAWKRWLSVYGWDQGRDAFSRRHPELTTSGKGTLQIRPAQGAAITDADFLELIREALSD